MINCGSLWCGCDVVDMDGVEDEGHDIICGNGLA